MAINTGSGWSWSVAGGWKYNGKSVPAGPTTQQGTAYKASQDPVLQQAGFYPSKPVDTSHWSLPEHLVPETPKPSPVLVQRVKSEAKEKSEAQKASQTALKTGVAKFATDLETGKTYEVSNPRFPTEVQFKQRKTAQGAPVVIGRPIRVTKDTDTSRLPDSNVTKWIIRKRKDGSFDIVGMQKGDVVELAKPTAGDMLVSMIPGYAAYRASNEGRTGAAVGNLVLDLLTFVAPVKMVSSEVRATRVGGSIAKSQAKGTLKAVLAEIKSPWTMIRHPKATARAVFEPIETVLRAEKLPTASLEMRANTVKIPVAEFKNATSAKAARDALFTAAQTGKKLTVTTADGITVNLPATALQKHLSGAVMHSTPDIRPFINGFEAVGREGGQFFSPTLHTRFTLSNAFGDIKQAKDAVRGALLINDEAILSKLKPSGKVYRGTVEIEKILPNGTKVGAPVQSILTRDAAGEPLIVLVFGKKLTKVQLAKMKFTGTVDTIKDIFRPAYTIKGSKKATKLFDELAEEAERYAKLKVEYKQAVRTGNKTAVDRISRELAAAERRAARITQRIDAQAAATKAVRMIYYSTDELIGRESYNNAARNDTKEFVRQLRALPESRQRDIITNLSNDARRAVDREYPPARQMPNIPIQRVPPERQPERGVPSRPPTRTTPTSGTVRIPPSEPERPTGTGTPPRTPERPPRRTPPRRGTPELPPRTPARPPRGGTPSRPPTIGTPVIPPTKKEFSIANLTPEERSSIIAWKQGWCYKMIWKPYGKEQRFNSRKPVEGVDYYKGKGSPQRSVVSFGIMPQKVGRDMGIQDVYFERTGSNKKPRMRFKADRKRKTIITGSVGSVRRYK